MEHYTDLAYRYIKMKKARSILTILGVSISVMLLYIVLNLGWSYLLNDRAWIRERKDYEIVLFTEDAEQIEEILNEKHVKDATVGEYYKYDYYEPVSYPNATYINTTNPYRMEKILSELTSKYGVAGELNKDLASDYLQGADYEYMYVMILVYFVIAYIFAIFGVGIIRNSIQLTLFEQVKDFGNLRCIGSTKKQMEMVIYIQGMILEACGILLGVILGWIGSLIAGYLVGWKNTGFHFLPVIFIVAAYMFDLYFVMKENAKLVTGMSPVSAIRGEYRIYLDRRAKRKEKNDDIEDNSGERRSERVGREDKSGKKAASSKSGKKTGRRLGRVFGRIFGVEGEYAYKNLMRSPGRFFKVVTAMTFGVAAVIILSCGALAVLRYDKKMKDIYGYYPIFVSWYVGPFVNWEDSVSKVPFTKLNGQIKELDAVTDAKRIFTDEVVVSDYDKELYSHYTDDLKKYTLGDDWKEDIQKDIEELEAAGEDASSYRAALIYAELAYITGYDEQDLARCENDLIEGTIDVSDNGIIVVENAYTAVYDSENPNAYEDSEPALKLLHLYDYNLGDEIKLMDMEEYRRRLNEAIAGDKEEFEEKDKELDELNEKYDYADMRFWDEPDKQRGEELQEYVDAHNREHRKDRVNILQQMREEGCYKTYKVEGILNHNPNGTASEGGTPQFIVPASHFHDVVGREKDYFSGMMYHFEPFTLRNYEKVDWSGIQENMEDGSISYEYGEYTVSDYPIWEYTKRDMRNGIIAAALIAMFLVSMVMLNYINNTSSNIYMRRKEFAQLRVIGVSKKGLFKMVMMEGVIAAIISCVFGVILGAGISYGLIMWIFVYFRDVEFVFPWIPAIVSVVISILILCGAVYFPLKKMPNDVAAELATSGE
ncbi:MAG: ABC transporter permease [Lachnospiraceae bacterium]|nr:ABC transporter permease [Lachnospiraceae bacterium]